MEVILDGERRTLDVSDCANLAELVACADRLESGAESAERRVVVGIEIDDRPLSAEEMEHLESRPLDDIGRVSIARRSAQSVARSVLGQGALYSREIVKAVHRSADHFRSGRSDRANELLARVSESLSVFVGISACAADVVPAWSEELRAFEADLHPWLVEMIEAQSAEDPIGLGDLLEFEMATRIERWGARMGALAEAPAEDEQGRAAC
jgi:hypothetical protein